MFEQFHVDSPVPSFHYKRPDYVTYQSYEELASCLGVNRSRQYPRDRDVEDFLTGCTAQNLLARREHHLELGSSFVGAVLQKVKAPRIPLALLSKPGSRNALRRLWRLSPGHAARPEPEVRRVVSMHASVSWSVSDAFKMIDGEKFGKELFVLGEGRSESQLLAFQDATCKNKVSCNSQNRAELLDLNHGLRIFGPKVPKEGKKKNVDGGVEVCDRLTGFVLEEGNIVAKGCLAGFEVEMQRDRRRAADSEVSRESQSCWLRIDEDLSWLPSERINPEANLSREAVPPSELKPPCKRGKLVHAEVSRRCVEPCTCLSVWYLTYQSFFGREVIASGWCRRDNGEGWATTPGYIPRSGKLND